MSSFGFNFRSTAGFVTDNANETFVLGDTSGTDSYPTTRNGITFGWSAHATLDNRDRINTNIPELAGINFSGNGTGVPAVFRVDLPAAGSWDIRAAFGDASNSCAVYASFADNATTFQTLTNITPATNNFIDAQGNAWSNTTWAGSNVAFTRNFASNILFVSIADPTGLGSSITPLAFLGLFQLAVPEALQESEWHPMEPQTEARIISVW